jgi:hypothetical protein
MKVIEDEIWVKVSHVPGLAASATASGETASDGLLNGRLINLWYINFTLFKLALGLTLCYFMHRGYTK